MLLKFKEEKLGNTVLTEGKEDGEVLEGESKDKIDNPVVKAFNQAFRNEIYAKMDNDEEEEGYKDDGNDIIGTGKII